MHQHFYSSQTDGAAQTARDAVAVRSEEKIDDLRAQIEQLTRLTTAGFNQRPGPLVAEDRGDDSFDVEPYLNAQLDDLRDRGDKLPPDQAIQNAKSFLATLPAAAAPVIQSRARNILGHFHLRMGDRAEARRLLDEGYGHAPDDRRAIANRVLSLWLADTPAEAYRFGCAAAQADPGNEWAAAYAVQAASDALEITDPLAGLPEPLRRNAAVFTGLLIFLRRREIVPEWWDRAREAAALHPDNKELIRAAALADVDEVSRDPTPVLTGLLNQEQRAKLVPAVACLDAAWREQRAHLTDPHSMAAQNLVAAMAGAHLLGERGLAIELAIVVADEGLTDWHLVVAAAQTTMNNDENALLTRLVTLCPENPGLKFYAGIAALHRGDLRAAADAFAEAAIPEAEKVLIETFGRIQKAKEGGRSPTERDFADALRLRRGDARAAVVISHEAARAGCSRAEESAYASAIDLARRESSFAARSMAAKLAADKGRWAHVIELIDGRVPPGAGMESWRLLTTAHAAEWPKRLRNRRFIESIPEDITDAQVLSNKALLLSQLGETESALRIAISLSEADPNDSFARLLRVNVLRRLDRTEDIKRDLETIDLLSLRGGSRHRVTLIHCVARECGMSRALAAAYALLRERPGDAEVASGYLGLFTLAMLGEPQFAMDPEPTTVALGTWVELTPKHGASRSFLIEEGDDFLGISVFSPNHERARQVMGRRVGDQITLPRAIVGPEILQITAIKSRTLHAFHILSAEFQERFPGHGAFVSLQLENDDLTPIIEMANRQGEAAERALYAYAVGPMPLPVIARVLGETVLEFADRLKGPRHRLQTCAGTIEELRDAMVFAHRRRGKGAVLDPYTAVVAATAGLLPALRDFFGTLYTPISTLGLIERQKALSLHTRQLVEDGIAELIEAHCCVEVALYPDDPNSQALEAARRFGSQFMDAAILSQKHGAILLSDDGYYRFLVRNTMSVEGLWLQAAMNVAHEADLLAFGGYLTALVELARRNHGHLVLNLNLMIGAFEQAQGHDLTEFNALANHVGTPDANRAAHFQFVVSIFRRLWVLGATYDVLRVKQATSLILEKLLRCYPPGHWPLVILEMFEQGKGRSRLQRFLAEWIRGHFLMETVAPKAVAEQITKMSTPPRLARRGSTNLRKAARSRRMVGDAAGKRPRSVGGAQDRWS